MTEPIEIKSVKLKLGKQEVELTIEQARKLKDALDELLGKEVVREVVHDHCHHWWYSTPIVTYTQTTPAPPRNPEIWYTTSGGASYQVSNTTLSIQA